MIVVIGILAAIVIVAYSGITQQAQVSALKEDISGSAKILANDYATTGAYPATLAAANNGNGINSTSGVTWSYTPYPSTSAYCLAGTHNGTVYLVTSINTVITAGDCNSLVGWWTLDNNANDVSGNGYNPTANAATLTTGQNGTPNGAYAFNGSSGGITYPSIPITANGFSVSIWFKSSVSGDEKMVSTSTGNHIIQLFTGGVVRVCIGGPCTVGSTNLADGLWHFGVVEGDTTSTRAYIDGSTTPALTAASVGGASIGGNIYIGQDLSGLYLFNGSIDDVRIYNRALSTTEIQTLYAAGAQ